MTFCIRLAVPAALLFACGPGVAAPKPIEPTKTWAGSNDTDKLAREMPEGGVITNAKDFEKVFKTWKVADKIPEVNFDKEIVLAAHTRGSVLKLSATLDDDGNLKSSAISTRDLRPGFRYMLISVPRAGVKTVNGKDLPK